jgi:hypothetical protein
MAGIRLPIQGHLCRKLRRLLARILHWYFAARAPMKHRRSSTAMALCVTISFAVAASACSRKDKTTPVAESGVQTSATGGNVPATVLGCLRAGEASDTFVLTTAGEQPVTYHLVGGEGETLRDNVGRQLEVSGKITEEQRTATRSTSTVPADDRPRGTAGTPQVQTETQLNVRRLEVTSVKPTGIECR